MRTPSGFIDLYSLPLYYDVLHGPGTAKDVRGLARISKAFGTGVTESPIWLEPACGSGRYLRAAARDGVRTIGFDLEPAMVEYAQALAKAEGSKGQTYFVADMQDFDRTHKVPKVDFAFNLINTIRHLPSDRAVLAHLSAVTRVLKRKAVYAVGMSMCVYGHEPEVEDVWKGRRAGLGVLQNITYIPAPGGRGAGARIERVISHLTVTRGAAATEPIEHIDSTYGLRTYNLREWAGLVERSEFEAIAVVDERGRVTPPPVLGYCIWVLRRKSSPHAVG